MSTAHARPSDWAGARGEQWRAHVLDMEAMLAPIDEPLFLALDVTSPARIADLGCGGGGTALELSRRAPAGSRVHGFDVSASLVAFARARPDAHLVTFDVADVTTATGTAPYDRIVSRFGVMFFDEPDAAFANLAHWLAPGGRFAFAVWGPVHENPWFTVVRDHVAAVTALPAPRPEAPGPFRYADPPTLLALLGRAGFVDLDVQRWRGPLPFGDRLSPEAAAHFALSSFSSFGDLLSKAGSSAFDDAHRSLTSSFHRHRRDGEVRLDASVHIVTGAKR